ncbi:MAG: dihydroorotate dehydrogenase electron transfer subunit, partial [Lachnospiraceae bacterium]|nr:dihydroorotate dehydrogenase electron transfer subunit [Lachnospiraceae bacterium]
MDSKGKESKKKETARVYKQQQIAPGIYDMWITTTLAGQARPGQFISVYTQDKSALLPRPISICETDPANG